LKDRRLYLWDIDGTLINSGGAGSAAMRRAFEALWKRDDGFANIEFSGRTDYAIFSGVSRAVGHEQDAFAGNIKRFKRAYFRRLPATLLEKTGRVLPAAESTLTELSQDGRATSMLGTGNFRGGARLKLRRYGLDGFFDFRGAGFGDKTEDRAAMIGDAVRSANRLYGKHHTVFVIGDTQHDVEAAKANGLIAIAVCTGTATAEELARAGADIVLPTLETVMAELRRK
jgi:phosphoglycolate phosphatase-like HAD superfamily hydrolase